MMKKNMKKRAAALVLAVCVAAGLLPSGDIMEGLLSDIRLPTGMTELAERAEEWLDNLTPSVSAATTTSGSCGSKLTWEYDEDTATLTIAGSGDMYSYTSMSRWGWNSLRDEIQYIVFDGEITSIGYAAFRECTALKEVDFPETLTEIGQSAFCECTSLTEVTLPAALTYISQWAFAYCTALTTLVVECSDATFGDSVFGYCTSLADVTMPEDVTNLTIGARLFGYCDSLIDEDGFVILDDLLFFYGGEDEEVVIPDGVTGIVSGAFDENDDAVSVTIPEGVTWIGAYAFRDSSVETVVLADSVETIGYYAFYSSSFSTLTVSENSSLKEIGAGAFSYCGNLKTITLTEGLETIGVSAFYKSSNLTSITIPDSVTSIGSHAFAYCSSLESIELPDDWTELSEYLFLACSSLTDIHLPENLEYINDGAFESCTSMTEIEIPESVTVIGADAFNLCRSMTAIELPDGLTSIGESAFWKCYLLTEIEIPSGVTSIENKTFYECTALTGVDILGEISSIGTSAFYHCTSLTEFTIPESVTSLGGSAFSGCTALTQITIPEKVESIGNKAFYGCTGLTSVIIDCDTVSIGNYAFYECTGLTSMDLPEGVASIGDYAFYQCTGLTSLELSEGVTDIGDYAFYACKSLTEVTIPGSVESVGESAFYQCTGLTSLTFAEGDKEGVMQIGWLAFSSCTGITTLVIPGSVGSIGSQAFYRDTGLLELEIEEGVTSIGTSAFATCSSLLTAVIPDSVESIGTRAFIYCKYLKSVTLDAKDMELGYGIFDSCTCLADTEGFVVVGDTLFDYLGSSSSIEVPETVTYVAPYVFYDDDTVTTVVLPESVTRIGSYALYYSNVSSISLPDSLTTLDDYAFYECELTEITIPGSVASIGTYVFAECTSLESVVVKSGVTDIGQYMFYDCTALSFVSLPGTVTIIRTYAFYNCSNLGNICLPGNVGNINDFAFYNCTALTYIVMKSVPSRIEEGAFRSCSSLTDVYFYGSEEEWSSIFISSKYSYNKPLTGATIHYDCAEPDFNLNIYRAQNLLSVGYGAEILDAKTYSQELIENGEENGLCDLTDVWDDLAKAVETFDNPANLVDAVLEKQDIYEAILMDILEVTLSASVIDSTVDDIYDTIDDTVSTITDGLELDMLMDASSAADLSSLSDEECEKLTTSISEMLEELYPNLSALGDVFSMVEKTMKAVDYISDFMEYMTAVILLANTDAYTQQVFETMYALADGNLSLQLAISECLDIMDDSVAEMIGDILLGELVTLGTDMAQYLIGELLWGTFVNGIKTSNPIVASCYYAYKASSLVTNVLFSTDDITEQYAKMDAFLDIEDLVDETFEELKTSAELNGDEDSCGTFLAAFDLIYSVRDEDIQEAYEFVDILDDTIISKLISLVTGDTTYDDFKDSLLGMQVTYTYAYETLRVQWVDYLKVDYPYSSLYEMYYYLLDESIENMRTKEYVSACPVDVYVYDEDGNAVAYYADGRLHCEEEADVGITLIGDEKTVTFYNDADYTVKYVGTDSGTMDVTINEYNEDNEVTRTVNYYAVSLAEGTTYELTESETASDTNTDKEEDTDTDSSDSGTETVYTLINTDTEETVSQDYDSEDTDASAYSVTLTNAMGLQNGTIFLSTTAQAGETIEITAQIPDGYEFTEWEITEGDVTLADASSSSTSFVMPAGDVEIRAVVNELPKLSDAVITLENDSYTYSGSANEPAVTVTYDGTELTEGTEYEVSYENNVDAGTAAVTVSAIKGGGYYGTAEAEFTITPFEVSSGTVTLSKTSYTYSGSANKPTVESAEIDMGGDTVTLISGTDYTVSYKNNTNAGTGTVVLTLTGNYTGTIEKTFTIEKKSISSGTVTLSTASYTYDGKTKKPSVKSVKVTVNGSKKTLTKGTDYTVSYKNNKKIGKASVVITLTGNYSGSITKTFTIKPAKVSLKSSTKSSSAKKLTVKWKKSGGSVKYQIAYKKKGSSKWTYKTVSSLTFSKTITGLKSGKYYYVKVRAYKKVSGKTYYGSWSSTKKVKIK